MAKGNPQFIGSEDLPDVSSRECLGTFFSVILLSVDVESPFDVLRIESDADEEEIEEAYRRRVKEAHPDHGGSVREFLAVRDAYERLVSGDPIATPASATEGEPAEDAAEAEPEDEEPTGVRVEYVDYEVLDDHGWQLDDEDLFEKADAADLDGEAYGTLRVEADETLLEAAERYGFTWPFACRGGACANCAVAVADGDLSLPVDHILPSGMTDRGIRLSCVGTPTTEEAKVVYNVKHLPGLDELRLPPRPFESARSDD